MSKSKGNGIDPLDWVETFGADALRFTLARGASPGGDLSIGEDHAAGVAQLRHQAVQRHQVRADERRRAGAAARPSTSSPTPTAGSSAGWKRFAPRWIRRSTATSSAGPASRCTTSRGTSSATGTSSWRRCSSPADAGRTDQRGAGRGARRAAQAAAPGDAVRHRDAVEGADRRRVGRDRRSGRSHPASRWTPLPRNGSPTCRGWSPRCAGSAATRASTTGQRVPARLVGRRPRPTWTRRCAAVDVAGLADRPGRRLQPVRVRRGAAVTGHGAVELDTSGTVDVAAERRRLEKDLAAAQKELARPTAKLGNEAFLAKAPDAVVDKIRGRQQVAGEEVERITGPPRPGCA